jgi:transcriptional regulator with XRE-family HTH domain
MFIAIFMSTYGAGNISLLQSRLVDNTENDLSPFSDALRLTIERLRKAAGVRQEDIAEQIGRNQTYVSYRVNGKHPWSTTDLDGIAELLGLSPFELVAQARPAAAGRTLSVVGDADTDSTPRAATEKARQRWEQGKGEMAAKRRPKKDTEE